MSEVGRPSELTPELSAKIRTLVLDGQKYKDIQAILGIVPSTWDTWVYKNYQGFRDSLRFWDNEVLINIAKANLHQLLQGDDEKIRADLTKFTLETLGKIDFSKRTDVTSGGEPLKLNVINYTDPAQLHAEGLPDRSTESTAEVQDSSIS